MTTMGAYRVLLVCVLCTLWCGAAAAAGLSPLGEKVTGLETKAKADGGLGDKAVTAQETVLASATGLLSALEGALKTAKAAVTGKETEAKVAIDAVDKAVTKAKTINATAQGLETDVKAANEKTKAIVTEAQKKMTGTDEAADMKQKAAALKKIADEAAALWQTAMDKTNSQLTQATEALAEVKTAKEATDKELPKLSSEPTVKAALEALSKALEPLTPEKSKLAQEPTDAETAITASLEGSKATAKQAGDFVTAAEEAAKKEKKDDDLKTPQEPPKETKNTTKNNDKTTPKNSSSHALNNNSTSDGSPLTVSCLAGTSVLLLLARVAAVMITA